MADPEVEILAGEVPEAAQLEDLYGSVGWTAYTGDPARLHRAVAGSFAVATAWASDSAPRADGADGADRADRADRADGGRRLVGLARILSDGETIAYLQDVLVRPELHRRGIARRLVEEVLAPVRQVRQRVLLTDSEPGQRAFYEALGFTEVRDVSPTGLRAFVSLEPTPPEA
ncbi:GNAT family N-acetyltransferase [Nesterenkonia sp. CL21]|uniref:GNAT family N-acetyltransferase n=1 Tax=Nesterenkonia sp. CL21 TaxID=3064894 RepID=UPI002879B182|nr:GNAT family N-acetyltransferase [Nesterenkonia sp. CL21]MDS2171263.1 GNAT family N-acetyltransferase [Nesterenkonia sp. CL21]